LELESAWGLVSELELVSAKEPGLAWVLGLESASGLGLVLAMELV
jgi:hypothetical protein